MEERSFLVKSVLAPVAKFTGKSLFTSPECK